MVQQQYHSVTLRLPRWVGLSAGQNMAFKCQKWRLAFSKFHKIILAFKTPKCDMFIINIGVYNAKKRGILNAKKRSVLNANILAF